MTAALDAIRARLHAAARNPDAECNLHTCAHVDPADLLGIDAALDRAEAVVADLKAVVTDKASLTCAAARRKALGEAIEVLVHIDTNDRAGYVVEAAIEKLEALAAYEDTDEVADMDLALDEARKEGYLAGKQEMQGALDRAEAVADDMREARVQAGWGSSLWEDRLRAALRAYEDADKVADG